MMSQTVPFLAATVQSGLEYVQTGITMAYQAFISYGHEDKLVADATCARLEARGIRCWIAPRDVLPGESYGEAISVAIRACRVLVLVFSNHANISEHVSKEVERAVSHGIPVVPLRIENVMPTGALDYFIGSVHWLDALTRPIDDHLERLADAIQRLLGTTPEPHHFPVPPAPVRKPVGLIIGLAALAVVLLAVGVWLFSRSNGGVVANARITNTLPIPATDNSLRAAAAAAPIGIVGCWLWFNNATLRMEPDGRISGTPFNAHWRAEGGNRYSLHWPMIIESIVLAPDGRSAGGTNNFGWPMNGHRVSFTSRGTQSLAGVWQWNGGLATFSDNRSIVLGPFHGIWTENGGSTFSVTWPNDPPVDELTLSAGVRLAGQNQFGIKISGNKIACAN